MKPKVMWTWTNWTFGLWYSRVRKHRAWGIDLGPLEIIWSTPR